MNEYRNIEPTKPSAATRLQLCENSQIGKKNIGLLNQNQVLHLNYDNLQIGGQYISYQTSITYRWTAIAIEMDYNFGEIFPFLSLSSF